MFKTLLARARQGYRTAAFPPQEPVMPALVRLREVPGILGVSLRSGSLRLYAANAEQLVDEWEAHWPFNDLRWLGRRWVEPDMEDVFTAYSQGYDALLKPRQT